MNETPTPLTDALATSTTPGDTRHSTALKEFIGYHYSPIVALYKKEHEQLKRHCDALLEYARHSPTCPMPANKCDCGLKELMEEINPPPEKA